MVDTLLCLLGPTAVGKTRLAMALADAMPVHVISVDSAMIYRGMDIGTAKPEPAELAQCPHALIDILDPAESYSAARFLADARTEILGARDAGRLPLLVGGTMLYFRALREGLAAMPESDPDVRARLSARLEREGPGRLHAELAALDPHAARRIEPANRQRLLRALEVHAISGQPISRFWATPQQGLAAQLGMQSLEVHLQPGSRQVLHRRIERRFDTMLDAGFIDEVEQLYRRGDLHADLPAVRSVGYRQLWRYLDGEVSLEQARDTALAATRQLCKRQLTWMRGWSRLPVAHPIVADDAGLEGSARAQEAEIRRLMTIILLICKSVGLTP